MFSRFGLWAAIAACAASLAYAVPQILQVLGILPGPWDRILIFAPSLILAPAYVLTMAAVCDRATSQRRVYGLAALAIAIMYAVLVSIVYITQLSVVIPHDLRGTGASVAYLACCGQGQFTTGLDLLGYTLMSVSTLLAAPVFRGHRWTQRWLVANGLLAPFLIGQLVWPALILVGALWLVTFPVAMAFAAVVFARNDRSSAG